ncbi:hypothetical protein IA57_01980 [Mangrovimonas yunxiaonensis]|uniref:Putative auto-transporter adhesin head GIN domain-containing protein n=1 Tax=Mangrovimonas yunxiaonensis TaxID=1197477 RepID=A0A084TNY9_9FLAO|nr:DUF2807 domain-containing protein [Mangrovimonas yunxiaonensis]KFB02425.1 hypothetical protein IA57_01980 [Mangrovimonas yunxiaonensis]GGH40271.1 hypothetical protein GCM10011364_10240 [Mangrovimonas yunxiaonensis]
MLKKLLFTAILTLISIQHFSQEKIKGSRNVTIVETKIDPFSSLSITSDFDILLVKAFEASVEIETDDNLHDVINFQVTNNTLTFSSNSKITSRKKLNITVKYTDQLAHLILKNGAKVSAISAFKNQTINIEAHDNTAAELNLEATNLNLSSQGKAKLKLNIQSDTTRLELSENSKLEALINTKILKADLYQSAKAEIEGTCNDLSLNTMNFSNFIGKNFTSKNSHIIAEDSSELDTHTEAALILEASGNAEVNLYGLPKITVNKFSGTAKLEKKEL